MTVVHFKHGLLFAISIPLWILLLNLWTPLLYLMTPMQLLGHPWLPSFLPQSFHHLCLSSPLSTLHLLDQFIMLSRSTTLFLFFMASRSTLLLCLHQFKTSSMRSISTVQNGLIKYLVQDLLLSMDMDIYSTHLYKD